MGKRGKKGKKVEIFNPFDVPFNPALTPHLTL